MRIVVAPDSFKESAAAPAVCRAIACGLRRALPDAHIHCVPMADGGEGTLDALIAATGGEIRAVAVTGPIAEPVDARFGLLPGGTAVIEAAEACGLALVPPHRRNPAITTTYGVGELIRAAIETAASALIIGIGGSATNDGGAGMAQALGYSLRDARGRELERGGAALQTLADIQPRTRPAWLARTRIAVACDVDNPLCGPEGASAVYGPQKGASPGQVEQLDAALLHFGRVLEAQLGVAALNLPGAGAAGGLGAGMVAFCGAELRPGFELVAGAAGLRDRIRRADLVITGEGRFDAQSARGKTPAGVAAMAAELGVPVVVIAGSLGPGYESALTPNVLGAYAIAASEDDVPAAMRETETRLERLAELLVRGGRLRTG